MSEQDEGAGQIIEIPHSHDVLCGRGGLTNQHAGNEWFRRLVKSNRPLYRSCPKHTKILVAKAIVQAVQQQDPSGRFLEVADKDAKTWKQIPYKRCVDKTSQALREREQPEKADGTDLPGGSIASENYHSVTTEAAKLAAQAAAQKQKHKDANLADLAKAALRQAGLEKGTGRHDEGFGGGDDPYHMDHKRSAMQREGMSQPPWWRQGIASMGGDGNHHHQHHQQQQHPMGEMGQDGYGNGYSPNKRIKQQQDPEEYPSPSEGTDRQTSLFRFLSGTSLFGRSDNAERDYGHHPQGQRSTGFFSFAGGSRGTMGQQPLPNPSDLITMEAQAFEGINVNTFAPSFSTNTRQSFTSESYDHATMRGGGSQQQYYESKAPTARMRADYGLIEEVPTPGLMPSTHPNHNTKMAPHHDVDDVAPPPTKGLTANVSDWLTSFWPLGKEPDDRAKEPPPPPPPNSGLERSISSTIMTLARTPSQFLTSLKSGVTSMVFGGDPFAPIPITQPTPQPEPPPPPPPHLNHPAGSQAIRRDSLLDDYEETPMETRLRTITSL